MNSSSKKSEKEHSNPSEAAAEGSGERSVKNLDLLELTLGFGSASSKAMNRFNSLLASEQSSTSSFPSQSTKQKSQEMALGLKLGFETLNDHPLDHQHLLNSLPFPSSSSSLSLLASSKISNAPTSPLSSNFPSVFSLSWPVPNVSHHCSERPHPGLWFSLRSIINRDGEVLPQIQKAYIRVKNENVTVFMVKTYLVRKLGLSNEAQVEISCMGQILLHSQNLKNVRDEIWLPKLMELLNSNQTLLQNSHNFTTMNHLMSLDYGKCCLFN